MTIDDKLCDFHAALERLYPVRVRDRPAQPDRAAEAELIAAVLQGRCGPCPGDTYIPDAPFQAKITAIFSLIDSPYVELVRALLDTGSDANQRCDSMPLVVAAAVGGATAPVVVPMLVEHGADVRAADDRGITALDFAVSHRYWEGPPSTADLVLYLLERGADPLGRTTGGETPLWVVGVKTVRSSPMRGEVLRLLRAAARAGMAKRKPKTLTFKKRKEGFDLTRDLGIDALATYVRNPELGWVFLAVRAPIEDTARALVEAVPGARWERDCAKRHVEDGVFSCCVTRFVPAEWTLVLYGSAMLVKRDLSQLTQTHAAAIAKTLGVEVVAAIGKRAVAEYAADGMQVMHEYGEDEVFYAGAKQEMLDFFRERRIFVPPFSIASNGLTIELVLHGVTKEHVERLDAVIFGEI